MQQWISRTAGRGSGAAITLVSERCVTGTAAAGGSSAYDGTAGGARSVAQALDDRLAGGSKIPIVRPGGCL